MGIMDRVSRLVRANVNDMIDRAEDPEVMIDQILRDMESNISEARQQVAAMIAQEKAIEADLKETQKLSEAWGDKARRALEASKEDLAREALRRKRDNEENAEIYEEQLTAQQHAVEKLKSQLRQLEAKYQSTLSQRDSLLARQRRAKAQRQISESLTHFSPLDPSADLDRMERRIRENEAQAAAYIELGEESYDAQFAELDTDLDVEKELEALRAEIKGSSGAIGAGSES
jgi:phage shock protein A